MPAARAAIAWTRRRAGPSRWRWRCGDWRARRFQTTAGSALRKLVTAMQRDDAAAAHDLAGRSHLFGDAAPRRSGRGVVAAARDPRRVLRLGYANREGAITVREIEPLGYLGKAAHWYLVAWCRLRDALRLFRTDRDRKS